MNGENWQGYEITVPKTTPWRPQVAAAFIKAFSEGAFKSCAYLDVVARTDGIHFVIDTQSPVAYSEKALSALTKAYYPTATIGRWHVEKSLPVHRQYALFNRISNEYFDEFISVSHYHQFDPLTVVSQTMAHLEEREQLTYGVYVARFTQHTPDEIFELLSQSAYEAGQRTKVRNYHKPDATTIIASLLGIAIGDWRLKHEKVLRFSEGDTERYVARLRQPLAETYLYVSFDSPKKDRLSLLTAVAGAVQQIGSHAPVRINRAHTYTHKIETDMEEGRYSALEQLVDLDDEGEDIRKYALYLTVDELATLWHVPHEGFQDQPVNWSSSLPIEVQVQGKGTIQIGTAKGAGTQPISIQREDRQYHCYITGQTGMGKSTIMHNIIHQDIEAGMGVAVLDPHGLLIHDILSSSIPASRVADVVLLRCGDPKYPIPLNPFRTPEGVSEQTTFSFAMWLMKSLYADSWSSTRMETTMRQLLQLILADPEATPLDIQEVILSAPYRRRLLTILEKEDKISSANRQFWRHFDNLSPSDQRNSMQSILNRLSAFLGSPHLERMSCHPKSLDFRQLIREKKIVLIDLSGDEIKSEVGVLGAIFFAHFFLASQSLFDVTQKNSNPYYLFVDETQRFITTSLPDMFSEARKFGLALTLANQYIGQLDEDTRAGIINNVGTSISFACSPDEAKLTGKLYEPHVSHDDLPKLGRGEAVIRSRSKGGTLPAFRFKTLPPPDPVQSDYSVDKIAELSRTSLSLLTSQEVREWIKTRYESEIPSPEDQTGLKDFE